MKLLWREENEEKQTTHQTNLIMGVLKFGNPVVLPALQDCRAADSVVHFDADDSDLIWVSINPNCPFPFVEVDNLYPSRTPYMIPYSPCPVFSS